MPRCEDPWSKEYLYVGDWHCRGVFDPGIPGVFGATHGN